MINTSSQPTPSVKSLVLAVSGPDACKFLQGQFTCDVAALTLGQSTLGAYCNIKGRVESLFNLRRDSDDYVLSMHPDLLQPTLQELKKYSVFSKVQLNLLEQEIAPADEVQEIYAKIPALYPQTVGLFFPHDLNLPELGAVSFTKGCYRGQEIVARMQHRGNIKRSMYLFSAPASTTLQPGSVLVDNAGTQAGTVVRSAQDHDRTIGLAVITHALHAQALYSDATEINLV